MFRGTMRTGLFKRLQTAGLDDHSSLLLSGMAYPYKAREWSSMPAPLTRGAEADGYAQYMTGEIAEGAATGAQTIADNYLQGEETTKTVREWLERKRPMRTADAPRPSPSAGGTRTDAVAARNDNSDRPASGSQRTSEPSIAPKRPLKPHTVSRLSLNSHTMDLGALMSAFGATGPPMQSEDLDLAASAAIDQLARGIGGEDPRFRREVGSMVITGYMTGRLALGTATSRLAYSTPSQSEGNARRIQEHVQATFGVDVISLAGDASAFLIGGAGHAATLGAAPENEYSFPLLGIAATKGFACAIAEHDLFFPEPSKDAPARLRDVGTSTGFSTSQVDSFVPTDSKTFLDDRGRPYRVVNCYNNSTESTLDHLEATQTAYMLMHTLQHYSHDRARMLSEQTVLQSTEFTADDVVAIETIKNGSYNECTIMIRVAPGDPRGNPDYVGCDA